jgi:hypothetical protein
LIPEKHRQTNTRLWRAIRDRTLPRELLICGPAGTGKTYGVLDVLHCLCRDNPGLRVLIARQTRAALTESVLVTYEQEILPLDGMEAVAAGVLRRVRQAYRYPSGSEIVLGGLDNPQRILSTAWDVVFINEAIEGQEEAWETLLSRLNRPGRSSKFGYLIGDTNPGDPSHWLRKRIDERKLLAEWVVPHQANPRLHDGRDWTAEGHRYLASLEQTLTGPRRKRLLQGLWAAGEGAWFSSFDSDRHVSESAEYDPNHPVRLAIDCNGLHVAAVWWQERPGPSVTVFGDYLSIDVPAESNAAAILQRSLELCGGHVARVVADPAGKQRQGLNTTVFAEYQRSGLPLTPWPSFPGSVVVGLNLVESFLPNGLTIHPRCTHLKAALGNYMRAKRNGQWVDVPEDPQHPHEDLIDALRGGLMDRWPEGRKPDLKLPRAAPSRVF